MRYPFAVLLLALPLSVHAQEKVEKGQFYVAAGRFAPAQDGQFVNQSGQYGFVLGGGGRFTPRISWNIDLLFSEQRLDTPKAFVPPTGSFFSPVSQSGRADIETWGLGAIFKYTQPVSDWFEVYVGGGPGWYKSTLTVHRTRTVSIFLPVPVSEDVERTDSGLGLQWVAGANFKLGARWGLGFQWRRLDLKASFGPEVKNEVNVGGNFGLLYSRWVF